MSEREHMKRILILTNNDVGLYKFRKELILELINRGNKVYIALPKGELVQPLIEMGCVFFDTMVERRGKSPLKDFRLLREYNHIIQQVEPDIILTYTIKPNIYGGLVAKKKNILFFMNITGLGSGLENGGLTALFIKMMYKNLSNAVEKIMFQNDGNREFFLENKLIETKKAVLLNGSGVNLDYYNFCEYPSDMGKDKFLFVGRIMKEKGICELSHAIQRINENNIKAEFYIIGYMEEASIELDECKKNSNVFFYDFQEDIRPFIENCNALVLPSYHEGMSNVLLEAAAMGRPLITTNIHGCKEIVDEGQNGLLVNVGDADDLYEKIKKFIELPYSEKVKMGKKSRQLVEEKFDKQDVVNKTLEAVFCMAQ